MKLLDLSESQNCRIVLKECYEIFLSEFFVDDISISCQLHQKLKNESLHIASACNLAGSIEDVREFIDSLNINDENNDKITFIHIRLYLTLLFYIFEQAKSFYDKIKNEKTSFEQMFGIKKYEKDGNNLELLKCYVNFSKHPKDIVHSHHPTFFVENEYGKENSEQKFIFDRDQFFKFYLRKLNNNEREILFKTIAQKQNIKIVFEDLKDVTRELSLSIKEFLTYCSDDGIFQKIEKELSIELL
ncbi:hypothetical protein [Actinobacillus capsulatus]|uniref:hypothetical protein n=1 Tax=Actinobacillus capsulatus TaxID=717 RepID=UPI0003745C3B|nr:hypothetical protein [Actinobacillus capsulatus]